MKIGMILDKEFYCDLRVENEVQALRSAGYQVIVYCFSFDKAFKEDEYFGAKIIHLPVSKSFIYKLRGLTNTVFNFYPNYLVKLLRDSIKKDNIEVLHIHDLYLFEFGIKMKKFFPRIRLVGDLHENYVEGLKHYKFANTFPGKFLISIKKWEAKEIEWCKKFDYLITVIEEAVDRYTSLGISKSKMSVVANYVNLDSFNISDFDESVVNKYQAYKTLTYVGGFDKHRGLESVIQSLPKIKNSIDNFKLILVGSGSNLNELKVLSKKLNVTDNIEFEGWQPHSLLSSYIKASDVCLIPHLKTGHTDNTIPHKLFQYMLLKKPVLSSNCNPIERIVNETKCGMIFESNNPGDMADKAIELFRIMDRNNFGEKGYDAVMTKYNWNETSKNLIELYSKINTDLELNG